MIEGQIGGRKKGGQGFRSHVSGHGILEVKIHKGQGDGGDQEQGEQKERR